MKTKKMTGKWIGGLAGVVALAGALAYWSPTLPEGLARISLAKETRIEDLDASMKKQFPPGTPWAEVQRWLLENKIEHSPLLKTEKAEHKGWFQSHALFKDTAHDKTKRVHIAMELAFDEHSNLRELELKHIYSQVQ